MDEIIWIAILITVVLLFMGVITWLMMRPAPTQTVYVPAQPVPQHVYTPPPTYTTVDVPASPPQKQPKPPITISRSDIQPAVMQCPPGYVINVQDATYGNSQVNCSAQNVLGNVQSRCNYNNSCGVALDGTFLGDPCYGILKTFTATYQCIPDQ